MEMKIPFLEAMEQMPKYADLLSSKRKLEEEVINLLHQVSKIVQCNLPRKERDPGPFNLPMKLGHLKPKKALADLGASISLMPLFIAKRLVFDLEPSQKTTQLADYSIKVPYREFEDIPIQVGHLVVPCDCCYGNGRGSLHTSHTWKSNPENSMLSSTAKIILSW